MEDRPDPRQLVHGFPIPTENYCDQPYVVRTDDGAWLCIVTTGVGREGERGQHVVALRSTDQGRTWSPPVDVEPADGPEASYAVLLKIPGGRIYCFYNHNTDNLREVIADDPPFKGGRWRRVDSQGYFVFKYSDDHGRTWSDRRYPIPIRTMEIDRRNAYGGKVLFFWNVGKAFIHAGAGCVPLHKIGRFGAGGFAVSEGVLLRSENILTERDPERIAWETLPEGEIGLRTPPGGGPIAEEQSVSVLSDGSLYCVYRSIDGHPVCSYSRDGGRTWSPPAYQAFADGRPMKHPRAANFAWRCGNGKFVYWFHNHGGRDYEDRNPAWVCGGVEADGPDGRVIRWSQPEIILYDDDPYIRMSYPDLVEEDGRYFIVETQKHVARVHEVDAGLLEGTWAQFAAPEVATEGLLLDTRATQDEVDMPRLPVFSTRDHTAPDHRGRSRRTGFSIDFWFRLEDLTPGQALLDWRGADGRGGCLRTADGGAVHLVLGDARSMCSWSSDPGTLHAGRRQHLGVIVDAGPRIISFIVDGCLCDGGEQRQFGWGRFSPNLRDANGAPRLRLGLRGAIERLRVYGRALRTSEAVNNFRAGAP